MTLEDWFEWPDAPPTASAMMSILRQRAQDWSAYDIRPADTAVYDEPSPSRLIFMVDIVDRETASIVGSPRVEFDGATVAGCWGSAHSCDDVDPTDEDSFSEDTSVLGLERAAEIAADWLDEQVRRPVERHEWRRDGKVFHRRWLLADSRRELCFSDVENQPRGDLRAPDVVMPLRKPPKS